MTPSDDLSNEHEPDQIAKKYVNTYWFLKAGNAAEIALKGLLDAKNLAITASQERVRELEQADASRISQHVEMVRQLSEAQDREKAVRDELSLVKEELDACHVNHLKAVAERDAAQKEAFNEHELRLKVADQRDAALMALEDIAHGNYPGSLTELMNLGALEARGEMWLWSQKRAKEAFANLKKGEEA